MALPLRMTGPARVFEDLLEQLAARHRRFDLLRVRSAFAMAEDVYKDSMHRTGTDLMTHSLGVLEKLIPFQPDEDAVIACLLQHILNDPEKTLDTIQEKFGDDVRSIVSGVHLLSHVTMRNRRMSIDQLRLMFLQVSDDMRVILITLCAHSYALDRMPYLPPEEAKRVCRDTLSLFAPVAARLGIYSLKNSLEARAFPVAYANDSERIAHQLNDLSERYGNFLKRITNQLKSFLEKEGTPAHIEAREKQFYSIFQKMQTKSVSHVQELYDLYAVRVIVKDEASCYQVLGLLHRLGHPVQNRFKDYIAFPKPNGYQSLHTTLAKIPGMPEGLCLEVQVRTEQMHREAEFGIAAHWSYKEGGDTRAKDRLSKAVAFQEAVEKGKSALLTDQIFVLTPRGDIVELPEGATPLDFAFQVHTNLGISFRAARVNGRIVPLTYQLENGDIVEILRYREPRPSPRWTNLLKTASAKSRLKKYLAQQDLPAHIAVGRELLNEELDKKNLPPLDPDLSILRYVEGKALPLQEREELLAQLGQGTVRAGALLLQIDALGIKTVAAPRKKKAPASPAQTKIVSAEIPMPVRPAKCCKPDEGKRSPIVGFVGRGEIRVHRTNCAFIKNSNPERKVKVKWSD